MKLTKPILSFITIVIMIALGYGGFKVYERQGDRVYVDPDEVRVIDGDTVEIGDVKIRFLGVDTPENSNRYQQLPYGAQATEFVQEKIDNATEVYYLDSGENDRYGRLLSYVFIDGECLALLLIENKLAYETITEYGAGPYPDIANEILDLSEEIGPPDFENPADFRRRHRN